MLVFPILAHLCGSNAATDAEAELRERASRLAREILLIDTHVDTPYELRKRMQDISGRIEGGHFDYVRARQGGLDAVFMAAYVPPEYEEKGDARAFADETIDMIEGFARKWPEKFVLARSPEEIRAHFGSGRISLLMGIENGSALEGNLDNLRHFYDRGVRYITLVHSKNNQICDSSFDSERKWHGLSPFGRELVAEMNRLGMIVDVSHASDEAFYQIMELSRAPVVATHSACRHFTPGMERNMSDEMIRLLAQKGGSIQINFGSIFIDREASSKFMEFRQEMRRHIEVKNLQGEEKDRYVRQQWKEARFPKTHVCDVAANINFAVKLVGADHVGLGSDFDGVSDLPEGLEDASCYPNVIYELLKMGYREQDIRKICGANFLRVWARVHETAAALQSREK